MYRRRVFWVVKLSDRQSMDSDPLRDVSPEYRMAPLPKIALSKRKVLHGMAAIIAARKRQRKS